MRWWNISFCLPDVLVIDILTTILKRGNYYKWRNFCNDGSQNYTDLQSLCDTLSLYSSIYVRTAAWKSAGLSSEEIKPSTISLVPKVILFNADRLGLYQFCKKKLFTYSKLINISLVYE